MSALRYSVRSMPERADFPFSLAEFLERHRFTEEQFAQSRLNWEDLKQICALHLSREIDLQTTADSISKRLRQVREVHSLMIRIKEPEHLIAKIVRKQLE